MNGFGASQLIGMLLTLGVITAVGIRSGRHVKSAADFSTGGGRAGSLIVAGSLMGTLVGGAATIGTAQLAYTNGFSGVWFTLGAGLGCLALIFFAGPLRHSGCKTLQQILTREYGEAAGLLASLLGVLGLFIAIVAQVLSATALLGSLVRLPLFACAFVSVLLMLCYVLFGGVWGAGLVGAIKTALLYVSVLTAGALVLTRAGGFDALHAALPDAQYFNVFSRGIGHDGGEGLSMIFGVLSTQTYAQSVFAGRDEPTVRRGLIASALLIPPIGVGGVLVGLYMRLDAPGIPSAQVFPQFVLRTMPGAFAGMVLATLLITIVGAGAGLALGAGTILSQDVYRRLRPQASDTACLLVARLSIAATLAASLFFTAERLQAAILSWSFLSIALRGAMLFLPLCGALFAPGKIDRRFALAALVTGPLTVLVGKMVFSLPFDPLFLGMTAALLLMLVGFLKKRRHAAA